jgi:hypothetical protein
VANSRFYSNTSQQTTLSGSISSGATTINVAATTGFPPTTPYTLAVDYGAATEELVSVTGVAGTTLTVTRGYGGTSAQSHSLGAVVRHVVDATDLTDFRTHEAATAAVHGVAGTLVGTSDTQTLTNKTLTSPTVNGATFSGTVAGAHAYSGALTFSNSLTGSGASLAGSWAGAPTFTGGPTFSTLPPLFTRTNATDQAVQVRLGADTQPRLAVQADGKHLLGSGSAAPDVDFYRSAAKILGTTSTLRSEPTDTAIDGLAANLPASTTGDLLNLRVNGSVQAAMGSDGQFRIYGGNSPTSYTPTWSGLGTATMSRNLGWYWRIGKLVFIEIYAQFASGPGTGTTGISVTLPSTPFREGAGANSTRQLITGWADAMNIMSPGLMFLPVYAGGSGAASGALCMYDFSTLQTQHLQAGTIFTIQGYYREA